MTGLHCTIGALLRVARRRGARHFGRLVGARGGTSAIEFALIGSIFSVMLLNVVDFATLIWVQMQVDYAAQAGVQAAYKTCSPGKMPATTNCANMTSVVTAAVQSTSLGSAVTLAGGSPSEGYYCTVGTKLEPVVPPIPPVPFNCLPFGNLAAPGDYVTVNVNYTFTPLFAGLSLAQGQTVQGMGMQRLQ